MSKRSGEEEIENGQKKKEQLKKKNSSNEEINPFEKITQQRRKKQKKKNRSIFQNLGKLELLTVLDFLLQKILDNAIQIEHDDQDYNLFVSEDISVKFLEGYGLTGTNVDMIGDILFHLPHDPNWEDAKEKKERAHSETIEEGLNKEKSYETMLKIFSKHKLNAYIQFLVWRKKSPLSASFTKLKFNLPKHIDLDYWNLNLMNENKSECGELNMVLLDFELDLLIKHLTEIREGTSKYLEI